MFFKVIETGALEPLLAERDGRGLFRVTAPVVFEIGAARIEVTPGFVTDGASVPRWARWAIETWGRVSFAAILHDYLLERTTTPKWVCDWCFFGMLRAGGVSVMKASVMWIAVSTRRRGGVRGRVRGPDGPAFVASRRNA